MAEPIELNEKYTHEDMGIHKADRADYEYIDKNGLFHKYVTSPYFRDLFYTRGYNDYLSKTWREDKGNHPDNIAAYEMGQKDAAGDIDA